jgi:hypothetical protein
MRWPYQRLAKNVKFLRCIFALLFALVDLSIAASNTHAAATPLTSQSENWSGHEAQGKPGTFKKVQILFNVPTLTSEGEMSYWAGLGGDPGQLQGKEAVLVQAGIASCLGSSCSGDCKPNKQCNYAWWEIANALVVQPTRFRKGINTGDLIYVYVQSNVNSDRLDIFHIQNRTTGETHEIRVTDEGATKDNKPISITTPNGRSKSLNGIEIVADGASAECVVERPLIIEPSGNTRFTKLPTFKSVTISRCDVGNNRIMQAISSVPRINKINMIGNPSGKISRPTNSARRANATSTTLLTTTGSLGGKFGDTFTVTQPNKSQEVNSSLHSVNFSGRSIKVPPDYE